MEVSCEVAAAGDSVQSAVSSDRYCIIVDDDPGICKALAFTLRKAGFETSEVATPQAFDAAMAERTPQLVLLDLGLGESGALDVLPVLAQHGYGGPVQLMSGRSRMVLDEVASAGNEYGLNMLPVLPKPFRMSVVKDLVASIR